MSTPEDRVAAEEAEILDPDVTVHLSDGRAVVVREIRYGQARRLGAELRPFVEEIARRTVEDKLDVRAIIELPEQHPELFAKVMEASTGLSPAAQDQLRDEDGTMLEVAFWRVNLGFFARRVAAALPRSLAGLAQFMGKDVGVVEAAAKIVREEVASTQGNSSSFSPSTGTTPNA